MSIVVDVVATLANGVLQVSDSENAIFGHEITEASFWRKAVGTTLDEKVGFLAPSSRKRTFRFRPRVKSFDNYRRLNTFGAKQT
ncbi:hypothetical protein [Mesorhizobium sp. WSM2561]|uniref:hypothetical protein n=1 Tax=Mesorhizobium sp. WSM2561 TaxID=1040985 RepID=UPI0004B9A3BF|nr:hypothetical protein [Mesorhizobium sp. WSM2561]